MTRSSARKHASRNPDDLRVPFVLFELEGHSLQEIAELSSLPIGTVKTRLRRARAFPNRSEQLRAETALLDEARRALARGDAGVALSRLTTYSERFSEPLLAPEAALLRVRALKAAGRTNEARSLAERELRTSADDAYAERIRRAAGIRPAPTASGSKPPSASF